MRLAPRSDVEKRVNQACHVAPPSGILTTTVSVIGDNRLLLNLHRSRHERNDGQCASSVTGLSCDITRIPCDVKDSLVFSFPVSQRGAARDETDADRRR